MQRREFLKIVGLATVCSALAPAVVYANSKCTENDYTEEGIVSHSCYYNNVPHSHTLLIPYVHLMQPPEDGVKLKTSSSWYGGHDHPVFLSKAHLIAIAEGQPVQVQEHRVREHVFTIHLPGGINKLLSNLS